MEKYNNGEALPLETRLGIYKELLGMYESKVFYVYNDSSFCFVAEPILMKHLRVKGSVYIHDHPHLLPELWDLRTIPDPYEKHIRNRGYWYKNQEERKEALQKAIGIVSSLLNGSEKGNTKAKITPA